MTEPEWLACEDPAAMVSCFDELYPAGRNTGNVKLVVSDRKLRLFACACCRRVWPQLTDERSRRAVEVAERFADGEATDGERQEAYEVLPRAGDTDFVCSGASLVINCLMPNRFRQESVISELLHNSIVHCKSCSGSGQEMAYPEYVDDPPQHPITCRWCHGAGLVAGVGKGPLPYPKQVIIIRDICGNPFRPVAVDPCWLTPTVLALAQAAYQERPGQDGLLCPDRLAILADALEDAGAEGEILRHLRGPGSHVRGCWALDLLLGKE